MLEDGGAWGPEMGLVGLGEGPGGQPQGKEWRQSPQARWACRLGGAGKEGVPEGKCVVSKARARGTVG